MHNYTHWPNMNVHDSFPEKVDHRYNFTDGSLTLASMESWWES